MDPNLYFGVRLIVNFAISLMQKRLVLITRGQLQRHETRKRNDSQEYKFVLRASFSAS